MPGSPLDQTVRVSFTPPNTWTFDPPVPRLTAAGKIILMQHPGSAPWKFVSAEVSGGGDQFHASPPNPSGSQLTIDDACTAAGLYPYTVTVVQDGRQYTNAGKRIATDHPPQIENAPTADADPAA